MTALSYDPKGCRSGIIHVGLGAFHRAHQAMYINQLLELDGQTGWGIVGVNLRQQDSSIVQQLNAQDCRYTLKTMSPLGDVSYQQIGSILECKDWASKPHYAAAAADNKDIHIITMTVTESGYYLNDEDVLDTQHEEVINALSGHGSCIYAYLRAALIARSRGCNLPITLLSCDNLRDNGKKLKSGFKQFLEACGDKALLEWTEAKVTFPCCMVDRITPRPSQIHVQDLENRFNIVDPLTVMSESFAQWVIEDDFAGPRPAFEKVGVQIVADVSVYEETKIRILNGGHTILVYLAALKGYVTYDQGLADPELHDFFVNYEIHEAIPALGASSIDLVSYYETTLLRFRNQNIADSVARICADGVSKFPIFIVPTVRGVLEQGNLPNLAIEGIAGWYVFMCWVDAECFSFEYIEPRWDEIRPLLSSFGVYEFVNSVTLWGDIPSKYPEFSTRLTYAIEAMKLRFPIKKQT